MDQMVSLCFLTELHTASFRQMPRIGLGGDCYMCSTQLPRHLITGIGAFGCRSPIATDSPQHRLRRILLQTGWQAGPRSTARADTGNCWGRSACKTKVSLLTGIWDEWSAPLTMQSSLVGTGLKVDLQSVTSLREPEESARTLR